MCLPLSIRTSPDVGSRRRRRGVQRRPCDPLTCSRCRGRIVGPYTPWEDLHVRVHLRCPRSPAPRSTHPVQKILFLRHRTGYPLKNVFDLRHRKEDEWTSSTVGDLSRSVPRPLVLESDGSESDLRRGEGPPSRNFSELNSSTIINPT